MDKYAYYKDILQGIHLPCAVVDLDLLDRNIQHITQRANKKNIRLATKSLRCVALIKHILSSSSQFQGLMSYTASETSFLVEQGFDDILIAYPMGQQADYHRIADLIAAGKNIVIMADHPHHFSMMEIASQEKNILFKVCLDIDMSTHFPFLHFGVMRSPLHNVAQVDQLIDQVKNKRGFVIIGLMGYDAQIAGIGEKIPGKTLQNKIIPILKKWSIKEFTKRKKNIINKLNKLGLNLSIINAGGTGSVELSSSEEMNTEITVGSGMYAPGLFDHYRDFKHEPAAFFALEICRIPKAGYVTALGGGYIASGAIGPEKNPYPYLPSGLKLTDNEGAGEVQTPFIYNGNVELKIGDPLFLRHSKAGELCERFNELLLLKDGKIFNRVPTYRGQNKAFV